MKVLYISHHKEPSGWGQAARDYILALDQAGVDIACRAVKVGQSEAQLPSRIEELQQKPIHGSEICIQHLLPYHMVYSGHFKKNIGLYVQETFNIDHTSWAGTLNLMDEIWVPNKDMISDIKNFIYKPIRLIPHTFEIEKYKKQYSPLQEIDKAGNFFFYFIGEFNRRKHVGSIIRAFHSEFTPNEPVQLLLKLNKPGSSPDQLGQEVDQMCSVIKNSMKLRTNYKKEIIIPHFISEEDLLRLHSTCDCFVSSTFGEAWMIPAFEAMAFGNTPICTDVGGMSDYIKHGQTGYLVSQRWEPVLGYTETFPEFGSSREEWANIDVIELQTYMRSAYEKSDSDRQRAKEQSLKAIEDYSYEKIGNLMKECINE